MEFRKSCVISGEALIKYEEALKEYEAVLDEYRKHGTVGLKEYDDYTEDLTVYYSALIEYLAKCEKKFGIMKSNEIKTLKIKSTIFSNYLIKPLEEMGVEVTRLKDLLLQVRRHK